MKPSDAPHESGAVARIATWLVILGVFGTFLVATYADVGPVWLASYTDESAGPALVIRERNVNHLWGRNNQPAPGGLQLGSLRGRWLSCLQVDHALDLPLQLVADGNAHLSIAGVEVLRVEGGGRGVQGKVLHFEPGAHALRLEFDSHGGRPGVALNASFDGKAPQAMPPASLPRGVRWLRPAGIDADPCGKP